MPQFKFSVRDQEGNPTSGLLEAVSREAALTTLVNQNLIVTSLDPIAARGQPRLSPAELLSFTQSVSSMLAAGMNLQKALSTLALDAESPGLREVLVRLDSRLSEGKNCSSALQECPQVFSRLYVALVEAGEASGRLPEILRRLAESIARDAEMRGKVKGALYYPAFVLAFACAMVFTLFVVAVPRLQAVYAGMNAELPPPTRLLISVGTHLSHWWPAWLALLAVGLFAVRGFVRSPRGARLWDGWTLRAPLLGPVVRKLVIARFARTLGVLYGSGIMMDNGLTLVAGALGNVVMEDAVREAASNLRKGESLALQLRRSKVFTNIAVSMVAAGEDAGTLETMLDQLACFYDVEAEMELRALVSLVEPALVATVGLLVGGVVITVALPFLQISSILQ